MMIEENDLSKIRKTQLNEIAERNLKIEITLYWKYKGIKCKKCSIIQGSKRRGFDYYYCKHYINKIERKMKNLRGDCTRFLGMYLGSLIKDGSHSS